MVGAGQLARMTYQAAISLDIDFEVLADSTQDAAVRAGARHSLGSPTSLSALRRLAERSTVLTFDHEHVPASLLATLEHEGHQVRPGAHALELAQDKLLARQLFQDCRFAVPPFAPLDRDPAEQAAAFGTAHGWPIVVKDRSGGYDGKGVHVLGPSRAKTLLDNAQPGRYLVEAHMDIETELAVVAARNKSGHWAAYPVVETVQREGICHELVMPARISTATAQRAEAIAKSIADGLDATGIIAVELFLTTDNELLINEIATRPHNSGHATIEAAVTSQFENHLRAILDWPLGQTSLIAPAAATVNILGGSDPRTQLKNALAHPDIHVHLYGKHPKPGRKLGHVTVLGPDQKSALAAARAGAQALAGND